MERLIHNGTIADAEEHEEHSTKHVVRLGYYTESPAVWRGKACGKSEPLPRSTSSHGFEKEMTRFLAGEPWQKAFTLAHHRGRHA